MMSKSLNYAYPQKFAEGGEVAEAAPQEKSTSYGFVDADGNSYNMGDNRPGHGGTSLERAVANVQEYYDLAPGSFTVNNNDTRTLMGTYDSASGTFQGADDSGGTNENESGSANTDAMTALEMSVGLQEQDMRYDADQDGRLGANDALLFEKYAKMPDYDDASGFMSGFYGEQPAQKTYPGGEPTYTDQVPGYTEGGVEFQGPDMPPFGMATTMAIGEEDTPFLEPDMDDMDDIFGPRPGVDPVPDTPVFSLPPGVDPMVPAPVTPSPVVNPVFTPSPVNTAFTPPPPPPVEGRTYGAYSGTPMGPTNSIQPFTPYMPPQQAQGPDLQSLITDTDYLLNNSGPRTSVFQRS